MTQLVALLAIGAGPTGRQPSNLGAALTILAFLCVVGAIAQSYLRREKDDDTEPPAHSN
jgi:hypothetical protein